MPTLAAPLPSPSAARPVDLVAFDVDGTLVTHPGGQVVWQLLAHRFGCDPACGRERFLRHVAGELSYAEWVDLDLRDFAAHGATRDAVEALVRQELALSPGAREVLTGLRTRGYRLAVISGTLDFVLDVLLPDHPFDLVFTNRVVFDADGRLASWEATPYDMNGKAHGLRFVADQCGVPLERCAFVGDHVNDLSALRLAGLPIAYHPKDDSVRQAARVVLPAGGLGQLLELLP